jgi:hypothetical protein
MGAETWILTLRVEHRLRVFKNRVLRRMFGPEREKVIGGWRRLHNEEFHNLYTSENIVRVIKSRSVRWAGHVACTGMSNAYKVWLKTLREKTTWKT